MVLKIDTKKKHEISPYLYMQFMEPLGVADASVDTAWDFTENTWFPVVIDKIRELAPTMVRFGGCFASYYHWREGVGKRCERVPMINHYWGGIYHNQIGTHEVLDFCRLVNAEPLLVVNMESEGLPFWQRPQNDTVRMGTAEEAAEWVAYCNDPNNVLRIRNGEPKPFGVKYWQIGNETSYKVNGQYGFTVDECYERTVRFAEAMRKKDNSIKLIGWGDKSTGGDNWCRKMSGAEGIDMLAFHHHFGSGLDNSPLVGTRYRDDYENTWVHLMNAHKSLDAHIQRMRADCGDKRLAITEGHFALPGRNRNEVLSSWGAGVAYARCLNTIMRHSDIVEIATMADFFGNVWQVNAVMIPAPIRCGRPYLQPVGSVMSLFGKNQGKYMLDISYTGAIDAVASATGDTVFLHLANTDMKYPQQIELDLGGREIGSAEMYDIAEDPETEITPVNPDVFAVRHQSLSGTSLTLPPAAVAAVRITLK